MTWLADRQPTHGDRAMHGAESVAPNLWRGLVGGFDPTLGVSGASVRDTVATNDAVLSGTNKPAWTTHAGRPALYLGDGTSGVDGYLDSPLVLPDRFSIAAWVSTASDSDFYAFGPPTGTHQNCLAQAAANRFLLQFDSTNFAYFSFLNFDTADLNKWQLVIATCPGTATGDVLNAKVFANGVEQPFTSGNTSTAQDARTNIHFGEAEDWYRFDGHLGACFVWDRMLSASESKQLYELGRGGIYHKRITRVKSSAVVPAVAVGHGLSGLEFGTTYDAGTIAPTGPQHIEAGITV